MLKYLEFAVQTALRLATLVFYRHAIQRTPLVSYDSFRLMPIESVSIAPVLPSLPKLPGSTLHSSPSSKQPKNGRNSKAVKQIRLR